MKCYCGSNKKYHQCCGKYIEQGELPSTPEQLMRSRYSAYSQGKTEYILATMCGKAAYGFDIESARTRANDTKWQKLEIIAAEPAKDNKGFVEFKAYYKANGRDGVQHELSKFQRIDGKWFYIDGHVF